jgi:hypothetical protein
VTIGDQCTQPRTQPRAQPRRLARTRLAALALAAIVAPLAGWQAAPTQAVRAVVRVEPKLYDARFDVAFIGFPANSSEPAVTLENTSFLLPMIMDGPFSRVDQASMRPELLLDGRPDRGVSERARLDAKQELGMTMAVIPIVSFRGSSIRWSVAWRVQSWSCRVDEGLLARATWPREWPEEVRSALEPQKGIESDQPFAKAIVGQALGDRLRQTAPWFAAKEILRTCVVGFRSVSTNGLERRAQGRVIGLKMDGARIAVERGGGTTHDLVAACVAALRAAGLPARPVVGIVEEDNDDRRSRDRRRTVLASWGEVFIPDCGWVPFDPNRLRGAAVRQLRVQDAWPGVGTWRDLNDRVPIAWCFAPRDFPGSDFASVWAWQPSVRVSALSLEATITVQLISRGRGVEDP